MSAKLGSLAFLLGFSRRSAVETEQHKNGAVSRQMLGAAAASVDHATLL